MIRNLNLKNEIPRLIHSLCSLYYARIIAQLIPNVNHAAGIMKSWRSSLSGLDLIALRAFCGRVNGSS